MAMCILHCDMRVSENIVTHLESRVRDRLNSGSSVSVEKFNASIT